ncbi:hypothetical protein BT96DRAFT_120161 [Gymnopus androsaceus JB14]|uniref:Nephrocystin 3-like N-terminal domain-containing protein n=1 Tax=Gymnopus androsaceus JB14 TaxID=1447944 RepID=A0A6A4GCC2_9AGAR|nr:hypothetical protein BT96DRAFT_120161 [Gymnopus androsaceus JB14]
MEQLTELFMPEGPFFSRMMNTLDKLKKKIALEETETNKLKQLGKKFLASALWSLDKPDVRTLLSDLERHKNLVSLAITVDTARLQVEMHAIMCELNGTMANVKSGVDKILNHITDDERRNIANWLSEEDFTDHQNLLEQRLTGTGAWILEESSFVSWKNGTSESRTLWCYGDPGVGKSLVAAIIFDHLRTMGYPAVSIFSRYLSSNASTPYAFLRALLCQLVKISKQVPNVISEAYNCDIHPSPDSLPDLLAQTASSHAKPVYIILDALDECSIGVDFIHAIHDLGTQFRLLITSRPVFQDEMEKYPSIKIRASDSDIRIAVDRTLRKLEAVMG